jgi:arginine deiminase
LLFVGIFTSAISVSRDRELRKEFYKSAESQLGLLKTIGVTQMEKELLKEYKPILDRSKFMEKYVEQPLEQLQVKEIIRDVLQELQSREGDNTKDKSK